MSQESNLSKKLSREVNMTPACSETHSVRARSPWALPAVWLPARKGHITPPRMRKKEKETERKKTYYKWTLTKIKKKLLWNETDVEGRPGGLFIRQILAQKSWPRYKNT